MSTLSAGTSLVTGLALTRLQLRVLWERYDALGGQRTADELLAYLIGDDAWTTAEHDTAARALNEGCADLGLGHPIAYAHEI